MFKNIFKIFKRKNQIPDIILCNWCGENSKDIWDRRQNFYIKHDFLPYIPKPLNNHENRKMRLRLCNECIELYLNILEKECKISPILENEKL